ncbi:MAG: hypothetical protein VX447_07140 [Pseudomonadota bacterium]|uniref:hypothetical protein n=1 Tax=Gallaecimonas pentaromativorans TaxID=584787 RepID=UPI00067E6DBB|nr:hypothetical protein [Gallaecimonas pentaromativorans]MED5524507.1 hypothetical protein [Pseudomonadota bacterium]
MRLWWLAALPMLAKAAWIPAADEVLAKVDTSPLPATRAAISEAMDQAFLSANPRLMDRLDAALAALPEPKPDWYWWQKARLLQHSHRLEEAGVFLGRWLALHPEDPSGQLLAARLALMRGEPKRAEGHCRRLMGQVALEISAACLLEARADAGDLADSYRRLSALLAKAPLPQNGIGLWLASMAADLALQLKSPQAALDWLAPFAGQLDLPASVLWAQAMRETGQGQALAAYFRQQDINNLADALLLELTLADPAGPWRARLDDRIQWLSWRQDSQHAAVLARYYLEVAPDAKAALYWAQQNLSRVKEPKDRALLARAEEER